MSVCKIVGILIVCLIPIQVFGWNPKKACPKTPSDPVKAQMTAGTLFSEAESHYQATRPMKALKGFLCSHRIMPHENTVFNIVQIAKLAEHRKASIQILRDFVKHVKGEHITQPIEEIIDELENGDPDREISAVDDHPGSDDETNLQVETSAQSTEEFPEEPVNDDAVNGAEGRTEPLLQTNRQTDENRDRKLKVTGIVMMSVGAGALLAGGTFQFLAARSQQKAADTDNYTVFTKNEDKMNSFQLGATIGYISGGVIFSTGLVLALLAKKRERIDGVQLSISPGYRAIVLGGRF